MLNGKGKYDHAKKKDQKKTTVITQKTKDRTTRTPLKAGGALEG
jgi:hypothetical protein